MDLLPARWRHTIRRFSCVLLTGGALALGVGLGSNEAHAQYIGDQFQALDLLDLSGGAMTNVASGYASGLNALANSGADAMAIGNATTALGLESTAVGNTANADFLQSTALGFTSNAGANFTTSIGHLSRATAISATALGQNSEASGLNAMALGWNSLANDEDANAVGRSSQAINFGANAFGALAIASGDRSTAIGDGSEASGLQSTALGAGSTADEDNSTAIGFGANTTREDQMMFGRADNTYTAPGITSAASLAAQTGPTTFVTSDAGGNLATFDLAPTFQQIQSDLQDNTEGVAMAIALGGAGGVLPEGRDFSASVNFGTFQGQNAMGFSGVGRLTDNVFLNGGLGAGLGQGTMGGRAGVTFAW